MMGRRQPLTFLQMALFTCPRCGSTKITQVPEINPGSALEWFRCSDCDHLWSLDRDLTEPRDNTH